MQYSFRGLKITFNTTFQQVRVIRVRFQVGGPRWIVDFRDSRSRGARCDANIDKLRSVHLFLYLFICLCLQFYSLCLRCANDVFHTNIWRIVLLHPKIKLRCAAAWSAALIAPIHKHCQKENQGKPKQKGNLCTMSISLLCNRFLGKWAASIGLFLLGTDRKKIIFCL